MNAPNRFHDTIYALASGSPPSAVAVVRLSGQHVPEAMSALTGRVFVPRRFTLATLFSAKGAVLDEALVVTFPGPASFTGETCAELHLHGGRAVIAAVLDELSSIPGMRHAEPGEFSRRALVNGKMRLTEAEALADLIDARTEAQRRLAVQQRGGGHEALYGAWRERLLFARAMLEAAIDFSDEEDVPSDVSATAWDELRLVRTEIGVHLGAYRRAEIIREGFRIAILGAPNAGKSSLLNCLARREVAIVSAEPGTTRDLLEIELDLDGMKVIVTDTAGIRDAEGHIEREGIRRAREVASRADLVLWLTDATKEWDAIEPGLDADVLRVATKVDLLGEGKANPGDLGISVSTGQGVSELLGECARRAKASDSVGGTIPFTARHFSELRVAADALDAALASAAGIEMKVEDLRVAGIALGRLIGAIDLEDILDVVFSRFCIGK